jgi:outer membrane protein assembly factor BamB
VVVVSEPISGPVRVLDRMTGSELWAAPPKPDATLTPAAADEAAVYVRIDAQLMAFEALSGSPLWTVEVGFPQTLSPLARTDDLVIASSGADIVAFSAADGTERWRRPPTEQEAGLFWIEPMAVADGNLYLTGTPTILAVDLATGATRWRAPDEWKTAALRATGSGRVLVQDEARLIHLLDAGTGAELWPTPVSIAPEVDRAMAPTLSPDSLYLGLQCGAVLGGSD